MCSTFLVVPVLFLHLYFLHFFLFVCTVYVRPPKGQNVTGVKFPCMCACAYTAIKAVSDSERCLHWRLTSVQCDICVFLSAAVPLNLYLSLKSSTLVMPRVLDLFNTAKNHKLPQGARR